MSMKVDFFNKLVDIAKTKKDGVYSKSGWKYLVKNGNIGYVGNWFDGLYQVYSAFHLSIWNRDCSKDSYESRKQFDLAIKELRKKEGI